MIALWNIFHFWWVLIFVAFITLTWCWTGYLRLQGKLRAGDARKINHILALAGGACWFGWEEPSSGRVDALAGGVLLMTLVVATCVYRKQTPFNLAFAGNTRPNDAPHEVLLFWSSWLVSILGLLLIELFVWDLRVTRLAALIVGIGDGVGEPVGSRWGRHRYRVPGFFGWEGGYRSLEGSLAVAVGTFLAILAAEGYSSSMTTPFLLASLCIAATATLTEALSPRGLDNLLVPLTAAATLVMFRTVLWEG